MTGGLGGPGSGTSVAKECKTISNWNRALLNNT
jgi:hypothetical protein